MVHVVVVGIIAVQALVIGQGSEAMRVLSEMRAALGGEKLAAVKSFSANARSARSAGQFQLSGDVEILCELPDKYVRTENLSIGGASASSVLGFSGDTLIQQTASPGAMAMGHGQMVVRPAGSGPVGGQPPSAEQQAAMRAVMLRNAKTDFTRLTVALLGSSFAGNPVEFTYAGQAESPDGKADVLEVKGGYDFAAKLYVDGKTRLPLMMSWRAPAATVTTMSISRPSGAGGAVTRGGGAGAVSSGGQGGAMSEDRMKEMMAAAEKLVEHRWYFSEYREVDGVKLPFQIVRSVDGNTTEELTFERFRINPKIDAKKFR
jgi:hypothetical protein